MEYQHGGDIYSQDIQMDYSANINPLGMPEAVRQALRDCLEREVCSLYPDSRCERLRQALGRHHGVEDKWIICGNGAADLIFGLAAALRPVRGLVTAPAFSEYEQALRSVGCRTDYYYLREDGDFALDAAGMCGCVQEAAERGRPYDVVFLCNPNNPTGIPVKKEEVEQLADTCERLGAYLAVDECFCDFLDNSESYSVIPDLARFTHLFVLKAFTKLYAMAGLRLGYSLCADQELNIRLETVRQPWSVSGPAQRAGIAALKERDYLEATKRLIGPERERMKGKLVELGFQVYPSQANYIFFRDPVWKEGDSLYDRLLRQGVLIRNCGNYPGLDGSYYRICVKTAEENDCFLRYLTEAVGR